LGCQAGNCEDHTLALMVSVQFTLETNLEMNDIHQAPTMHRAVKFPDELLLGSDPNLFIFAAFNGYGFIEFFCIVAPLNEFSTKLYV
jgi:hypothetical protein